MPRVRDELTELVSITSVADARQTPPEECARQQSGCSTSSPSRIHRRCAWTGRPTAATPWSGRARPPTRTRRPCCSTPTTTCSRRWTRTPGAHHRSRLTEVDGRWYGRGTADCKGNILMHLTALRALGEDVPVNLKLIVEGSEEQGTGGLEEFVPQATRTCSARTRSWSVTPGTPRWACPPRPSACAAWSTSW